MILSEIDGSLVLPYWGGLEQIRSEFESCSLGFPLNKCELVTYAVAQELGLQQYAGLYVPERKIHSWNGDRKRNLYIDLSMDQFEGIVGKIVVVSQERNDLLKVNWWLTLNQRRKSYSNRYVYE
ncbi:hypothetical protein HY494_03265 [Candidatus Woesearchaeota archaeon]|nr:hypothetical protein [Candidatus Woesearchaeota archaeon]